MVHELNYSVVSVIAGLLILIVLKQGSSMWTRHPSGGRLPKPLISSAVCGIGMALCVGAVSTTQAQLFWTLLLVSLTICVHGRVLFRRLRRKEDI